MEISALIKAFCVTESQIAMTIGKNILEYKKKFNYLI
jgi:hypothetical protein